MRTGKTQFWVFALVCITLSIALNLAQVAESSQISPLLWSYETSSPDEWIGSVAVSHDGNYIVMGTGPFGEPGVYLFGKDSNVYQWKYPVAGSVASVAISGDGSYLGASDAAAPSAALYLFNKSSNTPLWSYPASPGFGSIAISGDGNTLAAAQYAESLDHPVKLYLFDKSSSTPLWIADTNVSSGFSVSISDDGNYIVIVGNELYLFHRSSNVPIWTFVPSGHIGSVDISADGSYIAAGAGGTNPNIYLFHRNSSTPLWNYNTSGVVSISADGNYIAATSRSYAEGSQGFMLFQKDSNSPQWIYPTDSDPSTISISDNANRIAGLEGGKLYTFSSANNEPIWTYGSGFEDAVISGSGNPIAAVERTLLSLFSTVIPVPSEVWVDDDYCSTCPNDDHNWGQDAFASIRDGIDVLWNGGTVNVAAGLYPENIVLSRSITLMGAGANVTTIDGGNSGSVVSITNSDSETVVEGFTLINGKAVTPYAACIDVNSASSVIRSNIIIDNAGPAIIIKRGGVFSITNNVIAQNGLAGIYFDIWSDSQGDYLEIINNTIEANSGSGVKGYIGMNVNNLSIDLKNNIVTGNDVTGVDDCGIFLYASKENWGNLDSNYNNVWNNAGGNYCGFAAAGANDLSVDPEFVDSVNANYRLKDYSPCIGSGTSTGAPDTDISGNARPNPRGSNPDMGAYENNRDYPDVRPMDIFGVEIDNSWTYQGTYPGGSYTSAAEVISIDQTTFPTTTHIIEHTVDGSVVGKNWYETTPSELKLWGEHFGDFIGFSNALTLAWYPMQVGDHRVSSATVSIEGLIFNVSMTVDVLIKESIDLNFDTFEAYKLRYILRVWGHGADISDTSYRWVVPYLGFVKYQDDGQTEVLTDFAIGSGIITPGSDDDGDGLKDYQELIIYNTNWRDTDTDDDGLTDSDEVNIYGTNPNNDDTDNDGLTDGDEVNTHDTDPTNEDTDDDGLNDGAEINTYDTDPNNEDSDSDELTDGDEVNTHGTDPNDSDTDGDGLTDGEEVNTYGTNPNNTDTDGDGVSDKDEIDGGRNPSNWEPEKTELYLPPDGEPDVLLTAELETDPFSDPDGDDHDLTQWQIGKQIGNPDPCPDESFTNSDYRVFDGTSDTQLTLFNVPDLLLDIGTDYCWRARFTDTGNATSEWSDPFSFSTIAQSEDDQDPQNGIPDDQEADCLGIFDPGEIPQDTVCVDTLVGNAQVGIEPTANVVSIDAFRSVDPQEIPENLQGVELVIGLMSFKAEVAQVGDIMEITYHSSIPMPIGAECFKYDPINGWQNYSAHIVAISADRKSITIEYQDGGFGDLDGVANKFVIDPVGFGVAVLGGGGGGGGGSAGCFISTIASGFRRSSEIPALVLLFSCLFMGLSSFRKKLRK